MFTAQVPAELLYRDVVGNIVSAVCRHVESIEQCAGLEWRIISAFNEAFNNVVQHAYGPGHRGDITVMIQVDSVRLVLEVTDYGPGFEFDTFAGITAPRFESLDHGGMGLFIIQRAVSSVSYRRGEHNCLALVQELSACRQGNAVGEGSHNEGSQC